MILEQNIVCKWYLEVESRNNELEILDKNG